MLFHSLSYKLLSSTTFNKFVVLVPSYIAVDLVNEHQLNALMWIKESPLKTIVLIITLLWYIYKFINDFVNRKIIKENQKIEREILELDRINKEQRNKREKLQNDILELKLKENIYENTD